MSEDLGPDDLMEEELDLGLLDESDDDNVEVEEVADNSSKLQELLHPEETEQPSVSGDSRLPKPRLRLRLVLILFPSGYPLNNPFYAAG